MKITKSIILTSIMAIILIGIPLGSKRVSLNDYWLISIGSALIAINIIFLSLDNNFLKIRQTYKTIWEEEELEDTEKRLIDWHAMVAQMAIRTEPNFKQWIKKKKKKKRVKE